MIVQLKNVGLFLLLIFIFDGCSVLLLLDKDYRQYHRDLRHQVVPESFVNSTWKLLKTSDRPVGESCLRITFGNKGELILKFKTHELRGRYLFKQNSQIGMFTGLPEKFVLLEEECGPDPFEVSLCWNHQDQLYRINSDTLVLSSRGMPEFWFKKM